MAKALKHSSFITAVDQSVGRHERKRIVARSITVAEYVAFDAAIREYMWLLKIHPTINGNQAEASSHIVYR